MDSVSRWVGVGGILEGKVSLRMGREERVGLCPVREMSVAEPGTQECWAQSWVGC